MMIVSHPYGGLCGLCTNKLFIEKAFKISETLFSLLME